jgi:hypothetical protein
VFETFFDHLAALSSSAHLVQMFDSTVVRAHVSAAGANVWPAPLQVLIRDGLSSLHKRIRHVGALAAAKMEIRASRSS